MYIYKGKALAVLLVLLLLAACGKTSGKPKAEFKINYVEKSAEVILADGAQKSAAAGDVLPAGASVKSTSGVVDIGIEAGRAARLLEGAEVIAKMSADGVEFNLDHGTLLVNLKSHEAGQPAKFMVTTPAGVCGARGTAFYVKSKKESMDVGVENGEVYLRGTAGGEVNIPAGRKAVATLTAPVTNVENLLESERQILADVNVLNFQVTLASVRKTVAAVDVKSIESGLEMYRAMHGQYPDKLEDAMEGSRDPWGSPFNYIPSQAKDNYQLSSSGPDGKVNTSDDIRLR